MDINLILTGITAFAAAISAIFAAWSAYISARSADDNKRTQEQLKVEALKYRTIEAYNRLQDSVLDKLVSYPKSEVMNIIKTLEEAELYEPVPQMKDAYNDTRALIAKCEHFAVGVNIGLYDINVVNRLGGIHLVYLYDKVAPIIEYARDKSCNNELYLEFDNLAKKLRELNNL